MTENNPIQAETNAEQHSLVQSITLHLLPGVFILIFYTITAPLMEGLGHPPGTALFIAIGVILIPFELGYLLYQGKKRNGTFSLKGIVLYREPMPWWQYILLGLPLFLWLGVAFMILAPPIDEVIINSLFSWVPDWFFLFDMDTVDQYSQGALLVVAILSLTLNGIAGPVVEEMYFRGYLLPRLSRFGAWAPLINTLLFSLYHFFTPWQNVTRIIALIPMVYVGWWKKNIYLGMIVHCLANTFSAIGVLALALGLRPG
jgi:membrane protease YdiL (CAAX protease family)